MAKSPQVDLLTITGKQERKYTGRFLGFIKDDEFNALCHSKELANKIECKETQPLMGAIINRSNLSGYRLVLVVKKVNDTAVKDKRLFVSEKLDLISGENEKEKKVIITAENKNQIIVQER